MSAGVRSSLGKGMCRNLFCNVFDMNAERWQFEGSDCDKICCIR